MSEVELGASQQESKGVGGEQETGTRETRAALHSNKAGKATTTLQPHHTATTAVATAATPLKCSRGTAAGEDTETPAQPAVITENRRKTRSAAAGQCR